MYGKPVFGTVTAENPIAVTTHGKVMGENRDGVAIFRGIPYGDNCDGERRFLPPLPAKDWSGVRDCTQNGPICVQARGSIQSWDDQGPAFHGGRRELFKVEHEVMSENCLVLNVLTPGLDNRKRPVLFYIHGGGYASGSGALVLGAEKVCLEQDLVVVSVNHRLGPFGYLYLGEFDKKYEKSGIAGLLDLVLALQWVQENISAFGGDPGCVTISGESGGGCKVNSLLCTEMTKGLFHRAIIQSGSSNAGHNTKQTGTKIANRALKLLNVSPEELEKLAEVPTAHIQRLTLAYKDCPVSFVPTPDEVLIPARNPDHWEVAEWAKDIEIIMGVTEEEAAVLDGGTYFEFTKEDLRRELIAPQAVAFLNPKGMSLCTEKNVDKVMDYLEARRRDDETNGHIYHKVRSEMQFMSDTMGELLAFSQAGCKKLYGYFVTYDSHHPTYPHYKFAWHTATLPLQMRVVLHPEDEPLSKAFCGSIAAFARTGDPNTEQMQWELFTPEEKKMLVIGDTYTVVPDPTRELRELLADR